MKLLKTRWIAAPKRKNTGPWPDHHSRIACARSAPTNKVATPAITAITPRMRRVVGAREIGATHARTNPMLIRRAATMQSPTGVTECRPIVMRQSGAITPVRPMTASKKATRNPSNLMSCSLSYGGVKIATAFRILDSGLGSKLLDPRDDVRGLFAAVAFQLT